MPFNRPELIYAAIAGAVVGICYHAGRAWWAGDISSALEPGLTVAAAIGAAAGVLAMLLRGGR
ncbi:MAG: hypothetical protein AB7E80_11100 [Hyphomicrobiaceae bacterium]